MIRILLVDDHVTTIEAWSEYLEEHDFEVVIADSGPQALLALAEQKFDMCFLDMKMPGMSGLELLDAIQLDSGTPTVIMTGYSDLVTAKEAEDHGAFAFLTKPVAPEAVAALVEQALQSKSQDMAPETKSSPASGRGLGALIGQSPSMLEIFDLIQDLAQSDASVLILGETGTGKSLAAQEIHKQSDRATKPFVHLNCNAISPNLFESELFGHEKGAFTGAESQHEGRFERAQGGTLLLDEISNLPLSMQGKLLRVLEEGEFERVGGTKTIQSNVRIIAATNQPIQKMIDEGTFRSDLYYRLSTIPVHLAPLRMRAEDIPLLVENFVSDLAKKRNSPVPSISPQAMEEAQKAPWPGNIRQLFNAVNHAILRSKGRDVDSILPPNDSSRNLLDTSPHTASSSSLRLLEKDESGFRELDTILELPFQDAVEEFKKYYFQALLKRNGNRRTQAAKEAHIDRRTLQRYLDRLGMKEETADLPSTAPPDALYLARIRGEIDE